MMRKFFERQQRVRAMANAAALKTSFPIDSHPRMCAHTCESMEKDVALMTVLVGDSPRRELAVGALICDRKDATRIRKLLPRSWCGIQITRYSTDPARMDKENSQLAVHLSSVGAAFLHAYTQRRISPHTPPNRPQKHHTSIPPVISTTTTRINEEEDRGDGESTSNAVQCGSVKETPPAAGATDADEAEIPEALAQMLLSRRCTFHGGLRVGSLQCRGSEGDDHHMSYKERRTHLANTAHAAAHPRARAHTNTHSFRFCELFAGIGGFRLALENLGGTCSFASEIDADVRQVYTANFGGKPPAGNIIDIPTEDIPEFDLLTAGFPCQSWTETGEVGGFADPRGVLFFEITRLLYARAPAGFLLENVPGLASVAQGAALRLILDELTAAGYTVFHRILNARPFVPQRRLRLYFVGFRNAAAAARFKWPDSCADGDADALEREAVPGQARPTEAANGWPTVGDILEPMLSLGTAEGDARWHRYALSPQQWANICDAEARNVERPNAIWRRLVNPLGASRTLIGSYKTGFCRHSQFVSPDLTSRELGARTHTCRASADSTCTTWDVREEMGKRNYCSTTTGASGYLELCDAGVGAPRFFTERECCRLMGFPEWFQFVPPEDEGPSDHQALQRTDVLTPESIRFYHMIGNAVAPPVIEAIAKQMLATGLFD